MSSEYVTCHYGWCTHVLDERGRIDYGFGPVACPCDHVPGWKSRYPEGQSRPAVPARAKGRHGSRVQRSKRRHKTPSYLPTFGGPLPAIGRARFEVDE